PEGILEMAEIITTLETDKHVKVVVFDSAVEGFFLNHSDFLGKLEDLTGLRAFPDIGCGECLGQTEAEYNGSNSKQPWIHQHGEPQRFSANILAEAEQFYPFKSPTSAFDT